MSKASFLIFFILFAVLAAPMLASAGFITGSIVPCGTDANQDPCTLCHLFEGIKTVIDFLTFNIAAPIVVIALLIGGFLLLTSGESEQKRTQGKEAITYAIIGLIIVFGAWLALDLILGNLIDTGYWSWYEFPQCNALGI